MKIKIQSPSKTEFSTSTMFILSSEASEPVACYFISWWRDVLN